jgi:hypothetical protein
LGFMKAQLYKHFELLNLFLIFQQEIFSLN